MHAVVSVCCRSFCGFALNVPFCDGGFGRARRGSCPRPPTESGGSQENRRPRHRQKRCRHGRAFKTFLESSTPERWRVGEELFGYLGEAFPKPFLLPQHIPQTLITRRAFSRVHDYLACGRVTVYLRDF